MYIPEFWVGVMAALVVEVIIAFGAGIINSILHPKENKEDK